MGTFLPTQKLGSLNGFLKFREEVTLYFQNPQQPFDDCSKSSEFM